MRKHSADVEILAYEEDQKVYDPHRTWQETGELGVWQVVGKLDKVVIDPDDRD